MSPWIIAGTCFTGINMLILVYQAVMMRRNDQRATRKSAPFMGEETIFVKRDQSGRFTK